MRAASGNSTSAAPCRLGVAGKRRHLGGIGREIGRETGTARATFIIVVPQPAPGLLRRYPLLMHFSATPPKPRSNDGEQQAEHVQRNGNKDKPQVAPWDE